MDWIGLGLRVFAHRDELEKLIQSARPVFVEAIKAWPNVYGPAKILFAELFPDLEAQLLADQGVVAKFDVRWLQTSLNKLGFGPIDVDGIYGMVTHNAVNRFQKSNNLTVDGWCGIETTSKILIALDAKHG